MSIFEKIIFPYLDWIQLEVSSLCNASCFYCPHTTHKNFWKGRNITLEEFEKIIPFLKKVKLLYLQGWGEPFCNPDFFKFVELAKNAKCQVGATTNGMLLQDYHLEKIVDLRIDIIAFSLTGIKKNDLLRKGTKADRIFEVIKKLNEIKSKKKSSSPRIHIAFMLLRSNFSEIDDLPRELKIEGVNHIQVSFLDYIPISELKEEVISPKSEEEFETMKNKILAIKEEIEKSGIPISFNLPHPYKRGDICSENPLNSVFINSLGYVSPCVYTGIPSDNVENVYFGNIKENTLTKIWHSKDYKEFRKKHKSNDPPHFCRICPKMRIVHI